MSVFINYTSFTSVSARLPAHRVDLYGSRMFGVGDQDKVIETVVRSSHVDRVSAVVCVKQKLGHRVDHDALW